MMERVSGAAIHRIKHVLILLGVGLSLVSTPASAAYYQYFLEDDIELEINTNDGFLIMSGSAANTKHVGFGGTSEIFKNFAGLTGSNKFEYKNLEINNNTGDPFSFFFKENDVTYVAVSTDSSINPAIDFVISRPTVNDIFTVNFSPHSSSTQFKIDPEFSSMASAPQTPPSSFSAQFNPVQPPPFGTVPEPGALGLMGLGLFGLALSRRRRRKPVLAVA